MKSNIRTYMCTNIALFIMNIDLRNVSLFNFTKQDLSISKQINIHNYMYNQLRFEHNIHDNKIIVTKQSTCCGKLLTVYTVIWCDGCVPLTRWSWRIVSVTHMSATHNTSALNGSPPPLHPFNHPPASLHYIMGEARRFSPRCDMT